MTSNSFSSKWCTEGCSAISSGGAPLRPGQLIDCSFEGYEREPLALCPRVPPAS
jgi:hypothetical protein